MSYEQKYLKYKAKYLDLLYSQSGGITITDIQPYINSTSKDAKLVTMKFSIIVYDINYEQIRIHMIKSLLEPTQVVINRPDKDNKGFLIYFQSEQFANDFVSSFNGLNVTHIKHNEKPWPKGEHIDPRSRYFRTSAEHPVEAVKGPRSSFFNRHEATPVKLTYVADVEGPRSSDIKEVINKKGDKGFTLYVNDTTLDEILHRLPDKRIVYVPTEVFKPSIII